MRGRSSHPPAAAAGSLRPSPFRAPLGSPGMDPVLEHVRRTATDDPATLGVLLIGSRSTGAARPDSDYDVVWILTDDELASRAERHVKSGRLDIAFTSPARLAEHARDPGWFISSRGFPHQWADELEPLKTWRFE